MTSYRNSILSLADYGIAKTKASDPLDIRLLAVYEEILSTIAKWKPDAAAVEDCFSRFPKSALVLGQARGAVLVACASRKVPVHTYTATAAKLCAGAGGRGEKKSVHWWLQQQVLKVPDDMPEDASDALAQAFCYVSRAKPEAVRGTWKAAK
jgi:crossover junction endodeoxyribonuclease RuvC